MEYCDVKKCGAWCCKGFFFKFPVADEMKQYTEYHGVTVVDGHAELFIHKPCKHLSLVTNKCRIYEDRPDFCKTWFCEERKESAQRKESGP